MRFRILSGAGLIRSVEAVEGMSAIYESENLRIDMDGEPLIQRTPQGEIIACLGRIVGKRDKSGRLVPFEPETMCLTSDVDQLEGRFLLVCVDTNGACQVHADQFGKIEVFIQETGTGVALASDLSLLPEDPSCEGYDQVALAHMLTYYGFCPPKQHTIYKGVRRLGVGKAAVLDDGKLNINASSFTPAEVFKYRDQEHDEYVDIFLDHLKAAGSNEGNIVYLSSGWDSTSILAGLVHVFGAGKVRAIIGRMRYSERSGVCNQIEIDKAKVIADYFNIPLEVIDFEFLEHGPDFLSTKKDLLRSNQLYSFTALTHGKLAECASREAKKGEVVFAGEISDGAHNLGFSQYATIFHPSYGFREYSDKMASYLFGPTFLTLFENGEHEKDPVYNLFRSRAGDAVFDAADSDCSNRSLQLLTSFFLRNARLPLWSLDNSKLLTHKGGQLYTREMQDDYLRPVADKMTKDNLYSCYLGLYNSFHWQGSTVRSLSILADDYGLQSDLPFWDSRIQKFLSSMPEDWGRGLDLNPTKFPLKWMLQHRIDYPYEVQEGPHGYTYDVDHGFNHAIEVFYHSRMRPILQKTLSGKPYHQILSSGMFDLEYIDGIVDAYIDGREMPMPEFGDLTSIAMLCYVGWFGND